MITFFFREVENLEDYVTLNCMLYEVAEWCNKWDRVISYDKTVYLRITNKKVHLPFTYNVATYLMKFPSSNTSG